MAEALLNVAPDVELYVSNPQTKGDLLDAVGWMISEGVLVINHSVTWGWDGPGDGTWAYSNSPLRSLDQASKPAWSGSMPSVTTPQALGWERPSMRTVTHGSSLPRQTKKYVGFACK